MSRIIEHGDIIVTAPNNVCFAFTPTLVRVKGGASLNFRCTLIITNEATAESYTESREAFNGEVVFDIRRFLQVSLGTPSNLGIDYAGGFQKSKLAQSFTVEYIIDADDRSINNTVALLAVWGSIFRGESTAGIRPRVQFGALPFSLDYYAYEDQGIEIDGSEVFVYQGGDSEARFPDKVVLPFDIAEHTSATDGERFMVATPNGYNQVNGNVEGVAEAGYSVTYRDCEDGVYLRWVDALGNVCYYLFKETANSTSISAESWDRHDMTDPTAYNDGLNVATNVRQSFSAQTSRTLSAKLVDRDLFDMLASVATSPIVDVFDGYDDGGSPMWHRVNIAPNTIDRGAQDLQDFSVVILEPSETIQEL